MSAVQTGSTDEPGRRPATPPRFSQNHSAEKAARGAAETTRRANIGSPTEIGRPHEFGRFLGDDLFGRRRSLLRHGVADFSRNRRGPLLADRRGTAPSSRGDHHRKSAADNRAASVEQTGQCNRFNLHSWNSPFFVVKEVSRNDLIHGRGKPDNSRGLRTEPLTIPVCYANVRALRRSEAELAAAVNSRLCC